MAFDIVPRPSWTFPSFRFPTLWEEEDEEKYLNLPNIPSGLTVSKESISEAEGPEFIEGQKFEASSLTSNFLNTANIEPELKQLHQNHL